jgi:hypothetical protein
MLGVFSVIGRYGFLDQRSSTFGVPLSNVSSTSAHVVFSSGGQSTHIAHYTEHLAWLPNIGKDSRPEDRDSNAWTNDYAVGYWLSGPPEDLPDMLRRLKVVFDPSWDGTSSLVRRGEA